MANEPDINKLIEELPAAGTAWTPEADQVVEKMQQQAPTAEDDIINMIESLPAAGEKWTPEADATVGKLQQQQQAPAEDDLINMIESLPAAGTQWTPEADNIQQKMQEWKNSDQLGVSPGCVISNTYNACAEGAQQNVPDRSVDNKAAPVAPAVQQRQELGM